MRHLSHSCRLNSVCLSYLFYPTGIFKYPLISLLLFGSSVHVYSENTPPSDLTYQPYQTSPELVMSGEHEHIGQAGGAEWNPGNDLLLTWSQAGIVQVWDIQSQEPAFSLEHFGLSGATWNRAGDRILTWGADAAARIWDIGALDDPILLDQGYRVSQGKWSKNENYILTMSLSGNTVLWNAKTSRRVLQYDHDSLQIGMEMSPNELFVVTWGEDEIRLWDIHSEMVARAFNHEDVYDVQWNAESDHILSWGWDDKVRIWKLGQDEPQVVIDQPFLNGASWYEEGNLVLTSSEINVSLWDTETNEPIAQLEIDDDVDRATFDQDYRRILVLSYDGTIIVWDPITDDTVSLAVPAQSSVISAKWVPKSTNVIVIGGNSAIIYDSETGSPLYTMPHEDIIRGDAITNDGRYVATWSIDDVIKIWRLAD
jgi:WD40 repeat protein